MPHSEWFCTHLAELVGIPSIPCRVLEMPPDASGNRVQVFGSRWQEGEIPKSPAPWYVRVQQRTVPLASVAIVCSWIYAFDHFIHNFDRHESNFFAQKSRGEVSIYSVDYSNAWLCCGFPLPPLPFDLTDACHRTVMWQRNFTAMWGPWLNNTEVDSLLSRIKAVTTDQVRLILQPQPKEWLPMSERNDILNWWGSQDFKGRLDQISAGITSGAAE